MLDYLRITAFAIILMTLAGCTFQTPEIRGVVLDKDTKEPVEGAWIRGYIGITTKTVAGDVGQLISIAPPHLRTGKNGTFVIPVRELKKPPFPASFGTEVDEFTISAVTLDKSGSSTLDTKLLRKKKIEVTVHVEDVEKEIRKYLQHVPPEEFDKEREIVEFTGLQGLYRYCLTGRSSIERYIEPPGGCDEWELDYAITKHERYLERYREDAKSGYYNALDQLASLYERKGNFKKTIELLQERITWIEKYGYFKFEVWQRNKAEIERKINRLQQIQK